MSGRPIDFELRANIRARRARLAELFESFSSHWGYEDPVYRFYHHSFKIFGLQERTDEIVSLLRELLPDRPLNPDFLEIVSKGTGKTFSPEQNADWSSHTRPILEACPYSELLRLPNGLESRH